MKIKWMAILFLFAGLAWAAGEVKMFEKDVFKTTVGDLTVTCIGHGSLMLSFGKTVIHVDPVTSYADYSTLPKADLILITHEHGDHMDSPAIVALKTDKTALVCTAKCAARIPGGVVMKNGDKKNVAGVEIEAVPAYNIQHKRPDGTPFHPQGEGNGYVLTIGGKRIYIAGDTENIVEMKALKNIDIAFLPMNLPYTMTPEMVADAARAFKPKILYPYHYGDTDPQKLVDLLKGQKEIEVRIRQLR